MLQDICEQIGGIGARLSVLAPLLPAVLSIAGFLHWRRTRTSALLLLTLAAVATFGGWTIEPLVRHLNAVNSPFFRVAYVTGELLSGLALVLGTLGGGAAIRAYLKTERTTGRESHEQRLQRVHPR
jgi:hypothetical protein